MVCFGNNAQGRCAKEIIDWMLKNHLWQDTLIYVNNKKYGDFDIKTRTYHYFNWDDPSVTDPWSCVFVEENIDPKNYLTYAGDFLSMSFEGPLYDIFNYNYPMNTCERYIKEFNDIISKYSMYYELGDAWNLSLYPTN